MRPATFLMKKKVRSTIQSPTSDLLFLHHVEYFLSEKNIKKSFGHVKEVVLVIFIGKLQDELSKLWAVNSLESSKTMFDPTEAEILVRASFFLQCNLLYIAGPPICYK